MHQQMPVRIQLQKAALCGPPFCMFVFSVELPFFLRFEIQPTPLHKTEKMILRNIWAKNFLYRNCFSFCFVVYSNYFVFWLQKLLSATKTTKNPKTSEKTKKILKTKKNQRILRNVWAKDFVQRHFFFVFLEFIWFLAPEAFIGY